MWIYDYKSDLDNPYKYAPFLEIVHMCYMDNLPKWSYPFHLHEDSYELSWIMTGAGALNLDDSQIPLAPGSVALVQPATLHHFSSTGTEGMTYYSLRFRATDERNELQDFFRGLGTAAASSPEHLSYIRSTIRMLFSLHQANGGIVDETFQSIALGLIQYSKTVLSVQTPPIDAAEHTSASEILNYIMESDGLGITLESLAQRFHISPSHLSRLFCNAYHVSPINYAITARITYATEYLLKTDKPVVEVAELVGYDNPTHFTNMFLKRIGCTPSEFRARNTPIPHYEET